MEPYRIRAVEPLHVTTREGRESALERAAWNLFRLSARDVTIDLLTDSGTGAMSVAQWSAIIEGDESYAGSTSFERFEEAARALTSFRHIIPTHQGRAAERILFSVTVGPGDVVPNNTHFDTTRANVEHQDAEARDLPCVEGRDLRLEAPFKGDVDVTALERTIAEQGVDRIPFVMVTVTNNSGGGQPVSMRNLREVRSVCHRHGLPLILDAARFAENAWFVSQREEAHRGRTPRSIAEEMFRLADGCTMSMKKDALGNIGGLIGLNDDPVAARCRDLLVLTEGFPTYGGLAGRDLEALAVGLTEATDPDHLRDRTAMVAHLAQRVEAAGVATIRPPGGHAVYLDAAALLPHIPPEQLPGQALACELYLEGGVRGVEIGTLMFGRELEGGRVETARDELVRLAIPRRVYTRDHLDHVGDVVAAVSARADSVRGLRIVEQPEHLRHFTARLAPLRPAEVRIDA